MKILKQTDIYHEIAYTFQSLYNDGWEVADIRKFLEKNRKPDFEDEGADYWFSIAFWQWQTDSLEDLVFSKIKQIREELIGLGIYKENDRLFQKKIKELDVLVDKFQIRCEKPVKRKKVKPYPPLLYSGDCISIKLENGYYSAAIAVTRDDIPEISLDKNGGNIIALLDFYSKEPPNIKDVEKSKVLYISYREWNAGYAVYWYSAKDMKKKNNISTIGNIPIVKNIISFLRSPEKTQGKSFNYDYWQEVSEVIVNQKKCKIENAKPKDISLKEIVKDLKAWEYMLETRYRKVFKKQ